MNVSELSDKIKQLLEVSLTLLRYASEFEKLYKKYKPSDKLSYDKYSKSKVPTLLRFFHCSFFFDALLNLNTLLKPLQKNPNKKELSFYELLNELNDSELKEKLLPLVNKLRDELTENNIDKFRNKFVGHKDLSTSIDSNILYLNFIAVKTFNTSYRITESLNEICIKHFDVPQNNSFLSYYNPSFSYLLTDFEKNFHHHLL